MSMNDMRHSVLWITSAYPGSPLLSLPYITRELGALCSYLNRGKSRFDLYVLSENLEGTMPDHPLNRPFYDYQESCGEQRLFTLAPDAPRGFDQHCNEYRRLVEEMDIAVVHTEHLAGGVNLIDITDHGIPVINSYRAAEIVWVDTLELRRGNRVLKKGYKDFLGKVLPSISMHLPVSAFVASFLNDFQLDPDKVRVLHNGVNITEFPMAAEQVGAGPVKVLIYKRTPTLMRAVKNIISQRADIHFTLIGDDESHINDICRTLGDADCSRLSVLPRFDPQRIAGVMSSSNIILHVTGWDGCSNFVLEAMACGRPVIGCRGFGVDELIEDGKTGVLIDGDSESDIVAAVRQLAAQPDCCSRLGKAARLRVEKRFDIARKVLDYIDVYDMLTSGPGKDKPTLIKDTDESRVRISQDIST